MHTGENWISGIEEKIHHGGTEITGKSPSLCAGIDYGHGLWAKGFSRRALRDLCASAIKMAVPKALWSADWLRLNLFGCRSCGHRRRFAPGIQMVIVEHRIEQEHEAALGYLPPHGVVGKKDDVSPAERDIDDRRRPSQLRASCQHAADPQIFFVGEAQRENGVRKVCIYRRFHAVAQRRRNRKE